ncbi:MAG: flagellar biosynthesis anti-sigma factor FlgM [Betaproteobacteria bacterium]|nr:flagellar biosynthesis anti-sigma factor FlgM [Betaproteobacteria bacterium]MDE2131310.1 flagellar biosynthesis anti-sigma factor FlgM [Betaproteobacteria bacterium]MDE2211871.1 flagellar biosynthesis anti-sigma factor FlgM [Betaproteobacteria bacterium]MDE2624689.1 flagellar biosynthesis anti-sigma factor FlgM [Betaproteobacteria bacterium]
MKVEKSGKTPPVSPIRDGVGRAQTTRAPTSGADAGGAPPPSSTSVHLGENAAQLQSISESMAGTSVVNTAKVAEIKQAISEGRFQVNASAVADQLIASVTDLVNSRPH